MKEPKILITTGTHDNEEYAKVLFNTFKDANKEQNIIFFEFDHYVDKNQRSREVSFNLNRSSDIERLLKVHQDIQTFQKLENDVDIHIDIHNSPNCMNLNLISYTENSNKDFKHWETNNDLLYIFRETKFQSLSTRSRDQGKISVTVEIDGMNSGTISASKKEKDLEFIQKTIEDCIGFYNKTKGNKIYSEENYLKVVKLNTPLYEINNGTLEPFIISSEEIEIYPEMELPKEVLIQPVAIDSVFGCSTFEAVVKNI